MPSGLAGCERHAFDHLLPVLACMGRNILHTGPLGPASILKVITNYLATANLVSLCEAFTVASKTGMDLNTTCEAIRISSGNSFVHETESQVIFNGSREWSPNIIRRLEEKCLVRIRADGFPAEMTDDEPEKAGHEVIPRAIEPGEASG